MAFDFFLVTALTSVFGATILLRVVGGVKSFADLRAFCAEGVRLIPCDSLTGVLPRLLVWAGVTFLIGASDAGEATMVTFLVTGVFGGGVRFVASVGTCSFFVIGINVSGIFAAAGAFPETGVTEVFSEVGVTGAFPSAGDFPLVRDFPAVGTFSPMGIFFSVGIFSVVGDFTLLEVLTMGGAMETFAAVGVFAKAGDFSPVGVFVEAVVLVEEGLFAETGVVSVVSFLTPGNLMAGDFFFFLSVFDGAISFDLTGLLSNSVGWARTDFCFIPTCDLVLAFLLDFVSVL